jgi:putative addiction module killer protein
MVDLRMTAQFRNWLRGLRDPVARTRVQARLRRLADGNPGDVKPVGAGVSELRIDYGPGYRVYYVQHGPVLVIVLCGGRKRTQDADIKAAKRLAKEV